MGQKSDRRRQTPSSWKSRRVTNGALSRTLIAEARRKKLLVQTGYLWRWHEGVMAAIDAAQKGWLGEVFMVRGTMNSDRDAEQRATEAHYQRRRAV